MSVLSHSKSELYSIYFFWIPDSVRKILKNFENFSQTAESVGETGSTGSLSSIFRNSS